MGGTVAAPPHKSQYYSSEPEEYDPSLFKRIKLYRDSES